MLYLIAEKNQRYSFTVSELYENKDLLGPKVVFNMKIEAFRNILRMLTESGFLVAELLGGLDNIKLQENLKFEEVLKIIINRL